MEFVYPAELDTESVQYFIIDQKLQNATEEYKNGNSTSDLVFVNSRTASNRPLRMALDCEALGDIKVSEFGQTVYCQILKQEDHEGFNRLEEQAADLLPEGIDFKPLLKDDKFFLKLATKGDRYKCEINPDCKPSAPEKSPFKQNALLEIFFQPNVWINFEKKQAGIYLNISKIIVDGGSKKKLTRKR